MVGNLSCSPHGSRPHARPVTPPSLASYKHRSLFSCLRTGAVRCVAAHQATNTTGPAMQGEADHSCDACLCSGTYLREHAYMVSDAWSRTFATRTPVDTIDLVPAPHATTLPPGRLCVLYIDIMLYLLDNSVPYHAGRRTSAAHMHAVSRRCGGPAVLRHRSGERSTESTR